MERFVDTETGLNLERLDCFKANTYSNRREFVKAQVERYHRNLRDQFQIGTMPKTFNYDRGLVRFLQGKRLRPSVAGHREVVESVWSEQERQIDQANSGLTMLQIEDLELQWNAGSQLFPFLLEVDDRLELHFRVLPDFSFVVLPLGVLAEASEMKRKNFIDTIQRIRANTCLEIGLDLGDHHIAIFDSTIPIDVFDHVTMMTPEKEVLVLRNGEGAKDLSSMKDRLFSQKMDFIFEKEERHQIRTWARDQIDLVKSVWVTPTLATIVLQQPVNSEILGKARAIPGLTVKHSMFSLFFRKNVSEVVQLDQLSV